MSRIDPAKKVTKKVYSRTLRAVNVIRTKFGLRALKKMPKGVPGKGDSCPIFYALEPCGASLVTGSDVWLSGEIPDPCPFSVEGSTITCEGASSQLTDDSVFDDFIREFDEVEEEE